MHRAVGEGELPTGGQATSGDQGYMSDLRASWSSIHQDSCAGCKLGLLALAQNLQMLHS